MLHMTLFQMGRGVRSGAAGFFPSSLSWFRVRRCSTDPQAQRGERSGKVPAQEPKEALWPPPLLGGSTALLQGGAFGAG